MVLQKSSVSSQYLKESRISVTIIEMKSPAHFVIKESPSVNISSEAKKFVEAEEVMQKYYHSIEHTFFQLPLKDAILVVCKDRKFYRAQVRSILTLSEGHLFKVYLLDYGINCTVPRNCLFQIQQDFLLHPFQAVEFKLLNVVPISLVLNSENFGIDYGMVDDWDASAITFIEKLREGMIDAHIKVRGVGPDFLAGSLYMTFVDNEVKCINDELTVMKFAQYNTNCWNNVTKLSDILSKLPVHHSSVLQGSSVSTSLTSETPASSLVMKSAMPKLTGQHTNVLRRSMTPPASSPNSSSEMSPDTPILSKLPGQHANIFQGFTTPTSSPKKSPQVSPNSLGASPNLHMLHKNELHKTTPSSSSSSQGSPNSLVKDMNKSYGSVNQLQKLLKLREKRESMVSQKSPVKENVKESENVAFGKVSETEDKNTSESDGSSCSDGNCNKKQLNRLLNYHSLSSSKPAVHPKEYPGRRSLEVVEKYKSHPTSPPSSTSSDTSPSKLQTPVRKDNVSESNQNQSNTSLPNMKHKLTSPKLKIALEAPINRNSIEGVKPNLPSESTANITTGQHSSEEASLLKSPPKPSVKFKDVKNFLYRKRHSPSSAPQELNTETAKDNKSISELKNETNICQNLSVENKEDSVEIMSPESSVKKDLSESLNLDDMNFAEEDDFMQCALNPEIEGSSPSSPSNSASANSCSASFRDIKIDFSNKSLWEKQRVPALCLGTAVPKPILSTTAMSFPPELQKILDDVNFCGPSCIQSVVWPSVQRGRSLAAISPPHSGKTVAYLLPIVSNFILGTSYADLPKGNGPIAIIICSSWKKVQAVYDLFHIFLKGVKVRILTFFVDGRSKKNKSSALLNGSDVLITVPSCLLQFFKEHIMCINRCLHFILDDGSNLLTHCMDEMKQIMSYFVLEAKKTALKDLEIVICAERWTKSVASFVDKFMVSPLLLFTSFLEAAIYAKVPMYPHVCKESDKRLKLLEILESTKRTIICTTNSETASNIHSFLQYESVRSYLVNETQEHYISEEIIQDWKSVKSSAVPHCLIVTDAALSNMSISNANYLIHYDMPEVSRLQFGNRFSCIAEHFPNLEKNPECVCHIIMSGECTTQALPLMKIIRRCGVPIPIELKDLAAKEVIKNADSPLCHYYKAFGFCKISHCAFRHRIDPTADKPAILTSEGDVQALVTHVFDASHFYVRILKHLPPNAVDPVCMSGSYAKIGFQLRNYYTESNRVKVECPVIGGCYILQEENKLFFRVKVLNIIPATQFQRQKVELLFLDEGWVQVYENYQLFECKESVELPPPHAVEVYLCGMVTPDSSFEWNPQANQFIMDLIKDKEIHGKIALCLGETLWLHPAVLREKLLFINDYVNLLTLDKSLMDGGYAVDNKDHLPSLMQACADIVSLPKTIEAKKTENQNSTVDQPEVAHSFLELNEYENVYVSSVLSPHQVYVQRAKFVECLDDLLEKIEACIKEKTLKKCKSLQKGMHCIAPFSEDNRFYRARVVDITSDGGSAQLFFVDFGDSENVPKDLLYVLPPELLLLPFQAIECELFAICAPHGGWTDKTVDTLRDLTRDDAGDMKILQLKSYSKSSCYEGGYHYIVDLWNCEKSISEQLVEAGLVSLDEKAVKVVSQNDTWEEEEVFEDIPEGYILPSDEDLDPEDKDHHALFCAAVAKLLCQTSDKFGALNPSLKVIPEVSAEEEKSNDENTKGGKEIHCNKIEEVIEILPVATQSPLQGLQKLINLTKSKKEQKCAKPFITWWDTVDQLHILINLRDIQLYELDISDCGFKFKTSLRGMDYYTEENFYSQVHSENAKTRSMAGGVYIVLNKQKAERWPRFSDQVTKPFHIKYDLDHIDDSDTDETSKKEVVSVTEDKIDESEVVSYLSEDEISGDSDDDENFVQPWKKLAEYRDPFSPLE